MGCTGRITSRRTARWSAGISGESTWANGRSAAMSCASRKTPATLPLVTRSGSRETRFRSASTASTRRSPASCGIMTDNRVGSLRGSVPMKRLIAVLLAGVCLTYSLPARVDEPAPLVLETKIPLGNVRGRIDHLAIDLARKRLYVAELGNDSVGVLDLNSGQVLQTLSGLREPQGVGYAASSDTLYVSNAGDGSVRLYKGADLSVSGRIDL